MTIDERLEALTQTVELLAGMHKHNEARFNAFIERTDQAIARLDASIARLDASFTKLTEVSAAIGKVVLNREERIKRLEQ